MAKKSPNKLAELAKKINAEHRAALTAFRQSVNHARNAGTYLLQARELVIHGEWMPWVEKHCRFSYETAVAYIRVASRWEDEVKGYLQHDADLRLRELLKLMVRKPRPDANNKPRPDANDKPDVKDDKPGNDKVKPGTAPADVQADNSDLTESDLNDDNLNDDEAAELLTEKMHQHNINAELTDVLDFLTDVLGIGVDEVLRMLV